MNEQVTQPAVNLYALAQQQVEFITKALRALPLSGTAENLRPVLDMMDSIEAALSAPVKEQP